MRTVFFYCAEGFYGLAQREPHRLNGHARSLGNRYWRRRTCRGEITELKLKTELFLRSPVLQLDLQMGLDSAHQ
jgi:hypothetical protein